MHVSQGPLAGLDWWAPSRISALQASLRDSSAKQSAMFRMVPARLSPAGPRS